MSENFNSCNTIFFALLTAENPLLCLFLLVRNLLCITKKQFISKDCKRRIRKKMLRNVTFETIFKVIAKIQILGWWPLTIVTDHLC